MAKDILTKMVVFDMAGTTVEDSDDVHKSLINAMASKGYKITREDANRVMGYPKPVAIDTLLQENYKMINERERKPMVDDIHGHFLLDMLHHYKYSPGVKAKPNVEYVFDMLRKKGIKVVIDTGFSRDIADAIIDRLQWRSKNMIDYSVTSDEVSRGRPYPDMIQKAMAEFGITDPAHVAKVGDTPSDMMEGMNATCGYVIGITWGAYTRRELEKEKYTHLVDDLVDILPILK
jgi:phosphonatase-like hydrolase